MIQKIFDMDNGFWRAMGRVADMFWLNTLWLICCLPIFTIGPSTTALYYVSLKLADDKEGNLTRQFFRSFKLNFKQGVVIGLVELLLIAIAVADVMFYLAVKTTVGVVFRFVMLMFAVFVLMSSSYVYGILAKFDNSTKNILAFSFLMPIRHLGKTLVMIFCEVAIVIVTLFVFPPMVLVAMGAVAYINSKLLLGIFDHYIPEEAKHDPLDDPLPDLPEGFEEPVHIILDENHPEHVVLDESDEKEE